MIELNDAGDLFEAPLELLNLFMTLALKALA
jgi:hypothetical protein